MGNSVPSCSACDVTQREVSASTSDGLVALEAESVPVEIKSETAAPEKSAVAEVTTEGSPKEPTEPASATPVAAEPEAFLEAAKPAMLLITFEAKASGKETDLSFKTQPLPFEVKPEAKGGCCAKGNTGRIAVKKVDAKKAQEYYDVKPGMLIKKIDGFELPKYHDWPEFQKLLATKLQALPKEDEVTGIIAAKQEAAETEPAETPKDELPKTEAEATKEEAPKEAEAPKEETKEVVTEETKEAPKEAEASKEIKETEAVKEEKEASKEAESGQEAAAEVAK